MDSLQIFVLMLVMISAFYAVWFSNIFGAIISLSVMSLLLSLEFYLLQAPDVAIAEAAIGAGLSTTIYIFALRATSGKKGGGAK